MSRTPHDGTAILTDDNMRVKRGMVIQYSDSTHTIDGVIVRRYKLRNGNVKIWWQRSGTFGTVDKAAGS